MSSSDVYVWGWLPGRPDPMACGVIRVRDQDAVFAYGKTWLANGIALPGIPLTPGTHRPANGLPLHGLFDDALPDAWGKHVILRRILGRSAKGADTASLDAVTYMLESGSNRFGALDFQYSPDDYRPRRQQASLEDLAQAAIDLDEGRPIADPHLEAALAHGTSIGGARPKVLVDDGDEHYIVKLTSSTDHRPVVQLEAMALRLAGHAGIDVADAKVIQLAHRPALMVTRFDREPGGGRVMATSAMTLLGVGELDARYYSYPDIADGLADHGCHAAPELFDRVAANIVLGNDDDHARNHAALWDGKTMRLAPAFDIDPRRSPGWDSNQALAYQRDPQGRGRRDSNLAGLLSMHDQFALSRTEARGRIERVFAAVHDNVHAEADRAGLTTTQRDLVLGTIILNPSTTDGLPTSTPSGFQHQAQGTGEVWVEAHQRNGRHVEGHWRARPQR